MSTSALNIKVKLNNGTQIPSIALGTYTPAEDKSIIKQSVITAVKAGYRHIDTAWIYDTEVYVGEALKELFEEGVVKREDLFITTKVWGSFWDRPAESLNQSLERLQLDYVDLLLQHWPSTFKSDDKGYHLKNDEGQAISANGDYLETWKGIIELYKTTNKIRAIGVSNYSVKYLERLLDETDVVPAVNQVELHPQIPQTEFVKFNKSKGIVLEAYSPFGSSGAAVLNIPIIKELATKYDVTTAEIAVNYHVQSGRVVLPRSSNLERIKKGYRVVPLSKDDIAALDKYGTENPKRYVHPDFGKVIGFEHWG